MLIYFLDRDEEISFAINEEKESVTKKTVLFLSSVYGKEFDEIADDWADDYAFEKDTLIIKVKFFNEEILELTEKGIDILVVQ